jgi:hypothetical protein
MARSILHHPYPLVVLVSALSAILGGSGGPADLLRRAFLTSFSACVRVPTVIWAALAWRAGFEILDIRNLPYVTTLFVFWSLIVTFVSCLLAMAFTFLSSKRTGGGVAHICPDMHHITGAGQSTNGSRGEPPKN